MNEHADSDPITDSDPGLSQKHGSELILPGMAYDPNAEVRVNTSTVRLIFLTIYLFTCSKVFLLKAFTSHPRN